MINQTDTIDDQPLHAALKLNLKQLRDNLGNSPDLVSRQFQVNLANNMPIQGAIVYIDGLSSSSSMLQSVFTGNNENNPCTTPNELLDYYKESVIPEGAVFNPASFNEIFDLLLTGNSILLLDDCAQALAVDTKDLKARPVEEPNVQSVVRGPREGFTEVLSWNTAMIRRKINSRHLWFETYKIGSVTQTEVAVIFIENLVSDSVLEMVRERLQQINIDGILESNYIEEQIQDKKYSPFPTIFNSERPDVVAAGLLEGRVAIMVDGTPFALLVPALFTQFFQSSEDYYERADFSTLIRLLRFLSFILATITPSFYIAITTFHQELLPTTLLYNLASQREGVPFPAFVEALIMEITFEILREASVRMPKTIGQSISIVGTLVVGQAAVEAGLVSAAMVIVVSITAISNFVLPAFNLGIAARIIRFLLMIMAASFGLYGVFIFIIGIIFHLCSLTSFGVPYMAPLAPFNSTDQKDTLFRVPLRSMITRPKSLNPKNLVRQKKT
ncbi:spore germination protein [Bacillus sp. FJAT-26390]|uniref:spore germination protein n=1 Tax=Bacillus sp. FJAT-26390 TaxID=1743142 RepID=UPI000A614332|nr:spore germination protein [Bacillus sp. FJAT-26390]